MLSTMQDVPLTVTRILVHGTLVHGDSKITTWTGTGEPQRRTFRETGLRAVQLANALRDELGVRRDDRVATLMWNNAEHVEAYLAIPAMGAILHTLNLRLPAEQLVWITKHAADRVVLVNGSLLPLLAPLLPGMESVEHVVVVGPGDTSLLDGCAPAVHEYESLIGDRPTTYDWPELDEREAAAMCYTSGTTGDPKGVLFSHRSIYLHSMQVNMAESMALTTSDTTLPVVPMFHVNAWGIPHAAFMSGINLLMPDRFLQPGPLAEMIEAERPTHAAAVPTIWQGLLGELTARPRDISSLASVVIGGSACPCGPHGGVRQAGRARLPRVGHDRDLAARLARPDASRPHPRAGMAVPHQPGPLPGGRRGPPRGPGRRVHALGRRGGGRAGGARALDHAARTTGARAPTRSGPRTSSARTAGCVRETSARSRRTAT